MKNNLLPVPMLSLTICPHPFSMNRITRCIIAGTTIQEILDSIDGLPSECATSVQVDGVPIYPEAWSSYYPVTGAFIAVRVVPMGGEGDKDPLRTFLFLTVMVASFAVGGWVAGLSGSAFMGSMAAAATSMLGTLLVNAICPPAQSNLADRAGVNREGVVNSITGARNQLNPFGPIPVLLGEHRIVPFYGARPYTEIQGNDQYLRLLFVPCYTPVVLSSFKIGETDLEDFEDVELEIKSSEADADSTLYTTSVYEEALSVNLLQVDGWTTRTTQTDTDEIVVDLTFPTGLCAYDTAGNRGVRTVYYEIQYAIKDSGVWVELYDYLHFDTQDVGPLSTQSAFLYTRSSAWRIIINPYTGVASAINWEDGYYFIYGARELNAGQPIIPSWACPLADVTYVGDAETDPVITQDLITDTRNACLDKEVETDFLVTAKAPASAYVNVAAGDLRIRPFVTGQTNETVRKSVRIKVPKDQYDIRIRRVTADTSDTTIFDDIYWTALRSITYESPITKDNVATIALRMKATDQLNGVIDTFNLIGTSICKDWDVDTATWIERPTANPASLYRYVLQHPANKRAVADAKIDLVKLQEWHVFCSPTEANPNIDDAVNKGGGKVGIPCTDQPFATDETVYIIGTVAYDGRHTIDSTSSANEIVIVVTYTAETFTGEEKIHNIGLQYNALIDYQSSIPEILQQIAATGFASPTFIDGKYSIIIDQVQSTPVQHFTPRNSWNFSGSRTYPKIPHALRIIFANRLKNWEIDERIVYADDYDADTATLYEQLELPGVTDPDLAYVLGRYHLATLILRPERYSFYADVENLVSTRGDLIRVTHDVPLWGIATGRVKSIIDNGTHATAVVMDSIVPVGLVWTDHNELDVLDYDGLFIYDGTDYSIRFRLSDGSTLLVAVDTEAAITAEREQTTFTFTTPILLENAPSVDDLGLIGKTGSESVELLILSIEPGDDLSARIVCVDYSPAVYTASTLPIGEHESHISSLYGDVAKSGIPEIYQIRSNESVLYRDTDGSLRPRMVITLRRVGGYKDKIAYTEINWKVYETDEVWKILRVVGYLQEIILSDVEEGVEYTVRLRYVLHSGDPTEWCAEVQHTIIGKTTAPAIPTSISATAVIAGIKLKWINPSIIDFYCVGIWRAGADIFPGGSAEYVVPGAPGEVISFVDRGVSYDTTYYYWLKSYDTAGNASSESASVNASPKQTETADVKDANISAAKITDALQSENYVADTSGWFIGFRGGDEGYAEFNDVTIRGELLAGEVHIPDKTTAESFHIATDGDVWWGCNEADFITDPNNAIAYILKDGTFKLSVGASDILSIVDGGGVSVLQGGDITMSGGAAGNPSLIRFADEAVPGEIRFEQSGNSSNYWKMYKHATGDTLFIKPINLTNSILALGGYSAGECYQIQLNVTNSVRVDVGSPSNGATLQVTSSLVSTNPKILTRVGLEIDVVSGDPYIIFDTQGADKYILGVDDSDDDNFRINAGDALATTAFGLFLDDSVDILGLTQIHTSSEGAITGTMKQWIFQDDDMADDAYVDLPDATSGIAFVTGYGAGPVCATFLITPVGAVFLVSGTVGTDDADTDDTVCCFDNGTNARVRNRLGSATEIRVIYFYN